MTNNVKIKTEFTPLDVQEGYRHDGMLFAKCSVCGEHISFSLSSNKNSEGKYYRVWSHNLYIEVRSANSTTTKSVEYCPLAIARQEEVIAMSKLVEAYEAVIADITQDIGYKKGVQETVVDVLQNRIYELNTVWAEVEKDAKDASV
jgi:hypothetical protein